MLILTLWIVVVLSLVFYSLMDELALDTRLTAMQKMDMQAFYAARAGVARAVANLVNDKVVDLSKETQDYDCLSDLWAKDSQLVDVPLTKKEFGQHQTITYSALVEDENSKINLNQANYDLILGLLKVLNRESLKDEKKDDELRDLADAIWDWRDPDLAARSDGGKRESDYYGEKLAMKERRRRSAGRLAYVSKNDQFTTLEELLDVYGMTPEIFYGVPPKIRRHNAGRKSARDRVQRPEGNVVGDRRGLREFLTVWSNGAINVNTASAEVLAAVLVADGRDVPSAIGAAEEACAQRGKSADMSTNAFRTVQEFHQATNFPVPRRSGARLDVRSSYFSITALGEVRGRNQEKGIEHSIRVIVTRTNDNYPVNPPIEDQNGIWKLLEPYPPYYKKVRQLYNQPNMMFDPVVRVLQWIEW
ncbi:MAG: type II secretion system protein GspK [Candidatus Sumerlaeota bacterium]|nr:type II secretion system protein GspK [Candidatus Sumerlaeota bacterium]